MGIAAKGSGKGHGRKWPLKATARPGSPGAAAPGRLLAIHMASTSSAQIVATKIQPKKQSTALININFMLTINQLQTMAEFFA